MTLRSVRGWELCWKSKIRQLTSDSRNGLVIVGPEYSHESLSFGNQTRKYKRGGASDDSEVMPDLIPYFLPKASSIRSFHLCVSSIISSICISSICRTLFPLYRYESNLKHFLDTIIYKNQRNCLIQFFSLLNTYSAA